MNNAYWGAVATLTVFMLSNIGLFIYWSAKISTILDRVQVDLREIAVEMKAARQLYVTKEELSARVALSDKEHQAIWKQLDARLAEG